MYIKICSDKIRRKITLYSVLQVFPLIAPIVNFDFHPFSILLNWHVDSRVTETGLKTLFSHWDYFVSLSLCRCTLFSLRPHHIPNVFISHEAFRLHQPTPPVFESCQSFMPFNSVYQIGFRYHISSTLFHPVFLGICIRVWIENFSISSHLIRHGYDSSCVCVCVCLDSKPHLRPISFSMQWTT